MHDDNEEMTGVASQHEKRDATAEFQRTTRVPTFVSAGCLG